MNDKEIRVPTIFKTLLSTVAEGRIRIAILAFFPVLLISAGLYSLLTAFPPIADAGATFDPHEDFQAALYAFQEEYGFPGATAAYVLRDGTIGGAGNRTGRCCEDGTPLTVRSLKLLPVFMQLQDLGDLLAGESTLSHRVLRTFSYHGEPSFSMA